jgi:hypothetical protein
MENWSQSDRIISMMMLIKAIDQEMRSKLGIPKERIGHINKITDKKLLEDLLNYKPKNSHMSKFKNRFAVKGDIIELLKFERELLRLGYTQVGPTVFYHRSCPGLNGTQDPASHITIGTHSCANEPGQFTAANNKGCADVNFDLSIQFQQALNHAKETRYALVTEDGVEKCNGDDVWYVRPDFSIYHWKSIKNFNPVTAKTYKFFNTEETASRYIEMNQKSLTKQQVLTVLENASSFYQAYYDVKKLLNC